MTCKKCGGEMRLWLARPSFKSLACPSCEFVAIIREEDAKPDDRPSEDLAGARS